KVRMGCYGFAFKANIDDVRESPALMITERFAHAYPGQVSAVEPNIDTNHPVLSRHNLVLKEYEVAKDEADIMVVLGDHKEFVENPIVSNGAQLIIDTKGIVA